MNRRSLLAILPAAAVGAVPAAAVAEADTRILKLFRQYEEIRLAAESYVCVTDDEDAEVEAKFWRRADQTEAEMMALPCTCAADFAAKVIVDTARAKLFSDWETGALWVEARALVEGGPRGGAA